MWRELVALASEGGRFVEHLRCDERGLEGQKGRLRGNEGRGRRVGGNGQTCRVGTWKRHVVEDGFRGYSVSMPCNIKKKSAKG